VERDANSFAAGTLFHVLLPERERKKYCLLLAEASQKKEVSLKNNQRYEPQSKLWTLFPKQASGNQTMTSVADTHPLSSSSGVAPQSEVGLKDPSFIVSHCFA